MERHQNSNSPKTQVTISQKVSNGETFISSVENKKLPDKIGSNGKPIVMIHGKKYTTTAKEGSIMTVVPDLSRSKILVDIPDIRLSNKSSKIWTKDHFSLLEKCLAQPLE